MLAILAAMLLIGVIAPAMLKTVEAYVIIDATVTPALFGLIGVLIPVAALFVGFLLFYKLAPRRRSKVDVWQRLDPGVDGDGVVAGVAAAFCLLHDAHHEFQRGVRHLWGRDRADAVDLFSGIVIIFGGCLCAALTRSIKEPVVAGAAGRG